MYFYKTYGLVVQSELALPELPVWPHNETADVTITVEELAFDQPTNSAEDESKPIDKNSLLYRSKVNGVAGYEIEAGQQIKVDVYPGSAPGDVRLFLLGSAFGALLHQRRCLPLHVSSLITPGGLWAFTGESGAGKSTLAAALHYKFGWPLLSDDVGALLSPNSEEPLFYPGPPRLKLWKDALAHFNIDSNGLTPDLFREDKFHLSLLKEFQQHPHPLKALVVLERGSSDELPTLTPIKGIESVQAIMHSIYRPEYALQLNESQTVFQFCLALAQRINVYQLSRPWKLDRLDESLLLLEEQARSLACLQTN